MSARENEYGFAQRRIDSAKEVTLIEVITTEGAGTPSDVIHRVARYYRPDGEFVASSAFVTATFDLSSVVSRTTQ